MRRAGAMLWVAMGVLLSTLPASSHHAFTSEFDYNKTVTFTGVITKVEWINPHAYFYLEAKDRNGQVTAWTIESFPPAALRKAGMTRETMKIGDAVTIQAYPAKDGTKTLGWAHKIEFADGRVINISREPDAPPDGK
jgi:V8-like Glu-specific endopeptidase